MVRLLTILFIVFQPQGPTVVEPPGVMCCGGSTYEGVTIAAQRCPPRKGDWYGVIGSRQAFAPLIAQSMRGVPRWAKMLDDNGDGRVDLKEYSVLELGR